MYLFLTKSHPAIQYLSDRNTKEHQAVKLEHISFQLPWFNIVLPALVTMPMLRFRGNKVGVVMQ